MNQNEKKEIMGKFAKKLENAIKREVAVTKENRDLLREFGKQAKELLGKTMLEHQDLYKYIEDNSLAEKLK